MKIFISYAREQVRAAQSIQVRLMEEGHKTFFDLSKLPAGEGYDAEIRRSIRDADLFIFLISADSVRPSSYARTELTLAHDRWPNPSGRVLPVMAETTPFSDIPPYLTAITVLQPQGNLAADVVAEVAKIARRRGSALRWILPVAGVAGIAVLLSLSVRISHRDTSCYVDAKITSRAGVDVSGMMVDVTYAHFTNTFLASPGGDAAMKVGPFKSSDRVWTISLRAADGNVIGTESFNGCMVATQERKFSEAYQLSIAPRS